LGAIPPPLASWACEGAAVNASIPNARLDKIALTFMTAFKCNKPPLLWKRSRAAPPATNYETGTVTINRVLDLNGRARSMFAHGKEASAGKTAPVSKRDWRGNFMIFRDGDSSN